MSVKLFQGFRTFARHINLLPCPGCRGTGDGDGRNAFCPECLRQLNPFAGTRCPGCGGVPDGILGLCSQCMEFAEDRIWSDAMALFPYRHFGREIIRRFKSSSPQLARPLGILAAEAIDSWRDDLDVIVPIPLHWTRYFKRTYNQAELFADEVSRTLELPVSLMLTRKAPGKKQAMLGRNDRLANMRRIFHPRHPDAPSGKHILLVDDVLTTGSTLHAAAELLLQGGAASVRILVAARA